MPRSLTDLAGLNVSAEVFLAAVLDTAAQPIWVVDPDGLIRFANPAALAALGYDDADELLGCHSHETIHYRHPDGSFYPAEECPMLLPRATGERVARDLDWFFRRDGSMFPVSYFSVPIEMTEGRGAVVAFTDIEERLRAERLLRERDEVLESQQASLRRVADLVSAGAGSAEVFAAIAREAAQVLRVAAVQIWRYEPDATATVLGTWSEQAQPLETGSNFRIDDPAVAGAPIVVDGQIWGLMCAAAVDGEPLPEHIEDRLVDFTELVATAISNAHARAELSTLAEEQAALRRVATLVVEGVGSDELFGRVTQEVGQLFEADLAGMIRYVNGDTVTAVATWAAEGEHPEVPGLWPLDGDRLATSIQSTARPAREDDWGDVAGPIAKFVREQLGIGSSVGSPIVVEGRVWGALFVHLKPNSVLPSDTELRLANFTELVATALANAAGRDELAASRARLIEAADAERRRVVRDLHDGAQQRLVHTVVTLKLARRALERDDEAAPALVGEALDHAEQANVELRELAHGILPAVLSSGGLRAGVEALASRMPLPVELGVSVGRLPAAAEATAYFVLAEALTNVAKHSRATRAEVTLRMDDGTLRVRVQDDGVGGARPDGTGLVGLGDRLTALEGRLRVESPLGGGTLVAADTPVRDDPPGPSLRTRADR
jgi:PAS domain S-box-containing protein